MGEKAQYTQKGQKTLKIEIFHSHPCGFYIKNRPFAIEMAVWGLGLLLYDPYFAKLGQQLFGVLCWGRPCMCPSLAKPGLWTWPGLGPRMALAKGD